MMESGLVLLGRSPGHTQSTHEIISLGWLGYPSVSRPGRAGGGSQSKGDLGFPTKTAASRNPTQGKEQEMNR